MHVVIDAFYWWQRARSGCLSSLHAIRREENVDFLFPVFLFSSCRWSQNLAEQISPRRPKLPGGRKLRVCAHRPLLKRATAGLLLNVRLWVLQERGGGGGGRKRLRRRPTPPSCDAPPPPLRGGGATLRWRTNSIFSRCLLCSKVSKKKKKEPPPPTHTQEECVRRPASPKFCFFYLDDNYNFLFWCFQGLQKKINE